MIKLWINTIESSKSEVLEDINDIYHLRITNYNQPTFSQTFVVMNFLSILYKKNLGNSTEMYPYKPWITEF